MRPYDHLLDAARAELERPDDLRIKAIRSPFWFDYEAAAQARRKLSDLIDQPLTRRLSGVVVVGPYANGKSTTVRRFASDCVKSRYAHKVLYVEASGGGLSGLLADIWQETSNSVGLGLSGRLPRAKAQVFAQLESLQIRILVVDEFGTMLGAGTRITDNVLAFLRTLGSRLGIAVVLIGDATMGETVFTNPHMRVRLDAAELPRWSFDEEFAKLLRTVEAITPLKYPSALTEEGTARLIYEMSEGVLGEATKLVSLAAVEAVRSGTERVTRSGLEAVRGDAATTKADGIDWKALQ